MTDAQRPGPGPAPLPADQRPVDPTPVDTAELPATPVRDRNIPASAWRQAPDRLRRLGEDIGEPEAMYKRRIGRWLLWRAGPASRADARYLAVDPEDPTTTVEFRLYPDGSGVGDGPSGARHTRFREWKKDLLGKRDESHDEGESGPATRPAG